MPTPTHNAPSTCPHCGWAPPAVPTRLATTWKSHLLTHKDEPTFTVTSLPAPFLAQVGLHVCSTCNDPSAVYISQTNLDSHNKRKHSPARSQSNSDILHRLFPDSDWSPTLRWLDRLDISPPPFRINCFPHIHGSDRTQVYNTTHLLFRATQLASIAPDEHLATQSHAESTPDPLWKLLFLLQALLFCPYREDKKYTYSQCVAYRLKLLHRADVPTLYQHAYTSRPAIRSTQASDEEHATLQDPDFVPTDSDDPLPTVKPHNASKAQKLADQDEYQRAFKTLRQDNPVASLDVPTMNHIKQTLYPRPYPPHTTSPSRHNTRATKKQQHAQALTILDKYLLTALRSVKKGTAAGPFADYTDFLRNFALYETTNGNDTIRPYFRAFSNVMQLLLDGTVSSTIATTFRSTYFLALHKSTTDPLKLRPIGIGTCFRRLLCTISLAHLTNDFAAHLLPGGQLGVGIHGGIETIVHLSRTMLEQYISRPLAAGTAPSHAMLLLDIVNMFNSISRESVRHELARNPPFSCLLPLSDLLYDDANACWFLTPDSMWSSFHQFEGFAQGCPLSPVFAALGRHLILPDINADIAARTTARRLRRSDSLSYHDDTNHFLRHLDLMYYMLRFNDLGKPHGIRLSYEKTHILTSTTGVSPLPSLSSSDRDALQSALDFLTSHGNASPELTSGVRLLGRPLGGPAFTESFLTSATDNFDADIHRLNTGISDLQTRAVLFRYCARSTMDHLLDSDFYEHASLLRPAPPTTWTSSFTKSIDASTQTFFCRLTSYVPLSPPSSSSCSCTRPCHHRPRPADLVLESSDEDSTAMDIDPPPPPQLPPHAAHLLYLPAKYGGIGIRSPYTTTTASFVLPIARSIRLALNGITAPSTTATIHLPSSHRSLLLTYKTSDYRLFRLFRQYGCDILRQRFPDDPTAHSITTFTTSDLNLRGFQRDFHRLHYSKQHLSTASFPPATSNATSLSSPWMTLALHSLCRQHKDHRLDSNTYRISLLRRLRLPVFPHALVGQQCICGATLDIYGDHLFSCKSFHKGKLHNSIRDTLAALLRILAPLAAFTDSPDSISIETPQLLPNDLRKRPADVGMPLLPSYLRSQALQLARFLAVDITIPSPPPSSGASPTAVTATTKHHKAERAKFEINGARTSVRVFEDLVNQQILLLPFTVDHLGGLGPLAYRLLLGTHSTNAPQPTAAPPPNLHSLLLYNMA